MGNPFKGLPKRDRVTFDWKQLATVMVKAADLHEGIWTVYFLFERVAMKGQFEIPGKGVVFAPGAFTGITEIGLMRSDRPKDGEALGPMAVDAAIVNPVEPVH